MSMSTTFDPAALPKHQCTVTVDLDAPIDQCFAAASAEQAMMAWVPNAKSIVYDHSKAPYPYGPGSARTVTLNSGIVFFEIICLSEKLTLVGYRIPRFGMGIDAVLKRHQARMNYESLGPNRTRLTWKAYFDCPGLGFLFEPLLRFAMKKAIAIMASKMKTYLSRA
jgi:Polyketide cyclase / dehydrase and lipid transport